MCGISGANIGACTLMFATLGGANGQGGSAPSDPALRSLLEQSVNSISATVEYALGRMQEARIVAVEPDPIHAAMLKGSLLANDVADRVEIHQGIYLQCKSINGNYIKLPAYISHHPW